MLPPEFTRCCTHPGEVDAAGWITCDGSPPGICGCACRIPSNSQRIPKPTRSSRRAPGSCQGAGAARAFFSRPVTQVLVAAQAISTSAKISATIAHWCTRAVRKAETRMGLAGFSPEFMPGIRSRYSAVRRWRRGR